MKELFTYVLECIVCSVLLLAVYNLLMDGRSKFLHCRLWLVASPLIAAVVPALRIPVWTAPTIYLSSSAQVNSEPIVSAQSATEGLISPSNIVIGIYVAVVVLALLRLAWQCLGMIRLRELANKQHCGTYTIARIHHGISPFSFFNTIYISDNMSGDELKPILYHELSHISHRHSVERMVMEVVKAFLWWNPVVWILNRKLTEIEEFEADGSVIRNGYNAKEYIDILFKQQFGYCPGMANGLRNSLTKKRMMMMTVKRNSRYSLLRTAALFPLVAGMITAFSLTAHATVYKIANDANVINQAAVADTITIQKGAQKKKCLTKSPVKLTGSMTAVRGNLDKVLIVIDGRISTKEEMDKMNPEEIESIKVLKDQASVKIYGDKGKNGVILIATKVTLHNNKSVGTKEKSEQIQSPATVQIHVSDSKIPTDLLYVIDGKTASKEEMSKLPPDEIENISVLKGKSALKIYGDKGKDGVILITTRKGK
jgi:TonB-dependent SusC/RagA subfamily outer membrane receptor